MTNDKQYTNTDDRSYNGWANYETWNTFIWSDSDEGIHDYLVESAGDYIDKEPYEYGEFIKDYFNQLQENEKQADFGLFTDLLNSALEKVNWSEIASNYLEEKKARINESKYLEQNNGIEE